MFNIHHRSSYNNFINESEIKDKKTQKENLPEIHEYNFNKRLTAILFEESIEGSPLPRKTGCCKKILAITKMILKTLNNELQIKEERRRLNQAYVKKSKIKTLSPSPTELYASQKLYDERLKDLPIDERWRLFIDFKRQINEDVFDIEEPGYKKAMSAAFSHIRNNLGKQYNSRTYEKLHDICIDGVRNNSRGEVFSKGYSISIRCGFLYENATKEAKEEWVKEKLIYDNINPNNNEDQTHYLASIDYWENKCFFHSQYSGVDDLRVDGLFCAYYEEISLAIDVYTKITAIARLLRSLEILHSFSDGNQRTNAFALLTQLLIENGFPGCFLYDPEMFDGYYSLDQLVGFIIEGMAHYFLTCLALQPEDDHHKIPETLDKNGKFEWMLEDPTILKCAEWQILKNSIELRKTNKP